MRQELDMFWMIFTKYPLPLLTFFLIYTLIYMYYRSNEPQ